MASKLLIELRYQTMAMIRITKDNGKITLGQGYDSLPKNAPSAKTNPQKSAFELVNQKKSLATLGQNQHDPALDPTLTDFLDSVISRKS